MPGTFPRHRFQRKLLASHPGMHHGTCITHVSWCMSGSLNGDGGENVPGIPGACANRNLCIWQEAHCSFVPDGLGVLRWYLDWLAMTDPEGVSLFGLGITSDHTGNLYSGVSTLIQCDFDIWWVFVQFTARLLNNSSVRVKISCWCPPCYCWNAE